MDTTFHLDDGSRVPRLGFGTFQLSGEDAYRSSLVALETGYRHLDTAQGYDNEAEVGRALADSAVDPEEVFVTTKLKPSNAAAADVRRSTEESLKKLDLDHVDLLLLHWPAEDVAPLDETMEAMTDVRDAGFASSSPMVPSRSSPAIALAPIETASPASVSDPTVPSMTL